MSLPDAPAGLRLKVGLVILAFAITGIVLLWFGFTTLWTLVRAISDRAEVIALAPRNLIPLPLSITFLALAAMPFFPLSDGKTASRRRKPRTRRGVEPAFILLVAAACGALSSVAMLPISRAVVAATMSDRGYVLCPPSEEWERHAPFRWVRAGARCP